LGAARHPLLVCWMWMRLLVFVGADRKGWVGASSAKHQIISTRRLAACNLVFTAREERRRCTRHQHPSMRLITCLLVALTSSSFLHAAGAPLKGKRSKSGCEGLLKALVALLCGGLTLSGLLSGRPPSFNAVDLLGLRLAGRHLLYNKRTTSRRTRDTAR